MSKRTITLFAAVGVLAVVLLAYLIMDMAGVGEVPVETTAATDPELVIATYDYNDVKTVYYTYGGEDLSLSYNGNTGKWEYNALKKLPINLEKPTQMAVALSSIQANRYIGDSDEQFADFGLDEPFLTLGIIYQDGTQCEYKIGDYNPTTDSYYFNISGTNKVYMIATGLAPYFQYSLLELIEPDVLPALYQNTFNVKTVKVNGEALDDDAKTAYKNSFAQITLTKPVGWAADDTEKAKFGLDAATEIAIEYSEAQNVSDSEGTVSSTVHVDGSLTIYVGAESSEGMYYCMTDKSIVVYEVPAAVLGTAE